MRVIDGIRQTFKLKGDKAEEPEMYLGGSVSKAITDQGIECWTLSSEKYVKTVQVNGAEVVRIDVPKPSSTTKKKTVLSLYHPGQNDAISDLPTQYRPAVNRKGSGSVSSKERYCFTLHDLTLTCGEEVEHWFRKMNKIIKNIFFILFKKN